jgi:DNA-binding response OmpR family regulator
MTLRPTEEVSNAARTAVIVEDEDETRVLLVEVLESAGFSTVGVSNGLDGVRAALAYQPSVVTMDVDLPGLDGLEAIRQIRANFDTRIVIISGADEESDVLLGYSTGADVYIRKPFRPRELRAVIEHLMRRVPTLGHAPAESGAEIRLDERMRVVAWEGVIADRQSWTITVEGRALALTRSEFAILDSLVLNAPHVLTFDAMAEALETRGGGYDDGSTRYRTHITNLRRKLKAVGGGDRRIIAMRGVGYRLTRVPA